MVDVVRQFLPETGELVFQPIGAGLIHQTYKVTIASEGKTYILQTFSTQVFRDPEAVWSNFEWAKKHLKSTAYPFVIPEWLPTTRGNAFFEDSNNRYWRMLTFVPNSIAYEYAPSPHFFKAAAGAYGQLLQHLGGLQAKELKTVIPDFHHLTGRFKHLLSVVAAQPVRLKWAERPLEQVLRVYEKLHLDFSDLPLRATHNDCKLSNILFDSNSDECLAVIDWDTLMPGYLVTDFGDMLRSMCVSAPESERDMTKVRFLPETYRLIEQAFIEATQGWMTKEERERLFDGGLYIVLEQAIRFLSDYLEGDPYYGESYADQNLDRAKNQLQLLQSMIDQSM